jgi:hypothetical protein
MKNKQPDTFTNIFNDYGFIEKRGAYGIRLFLNKDIKAHISYDYQMEIITFSLDNTEYIIKFSVNSVIEFLDKKAKPLVREKIINKLLKIK